MGANVTCSAKERTVDTAPPTTGRVMVLPPNTAWSTRAPVAPTAAEATFRVIANPIRVPTLAAPKPKAAAEEAKSSPCLPMRSQLGISDQQSMI